MKGQETNRLQQTKTAIEDAFVSCYLRQPFHKVTVKSVVERCYVSRGTFYCYFTDLSQLLSKLEDEMIRGVSEKMDAVIIQAARRDEAGYVSKYVAMLKFISEHSQTFKALMFGSERIAFLEKYRKCIAHNVQTLFEVDRTIPKAMYAPLCSFHAGGVVAFLENWLETDMAQSPEELAHVVYRGLFTGLCRSEPTD